MIKTSLNELSKHVHEYVKSKGFWEKPRTIVELLCLVHEEVSEAVKEIRNGHAPNETYYSGKNTLPALSGEYERAETAQIVFESNEKNIVYITPYNSVRAVKPEGVPSELIDIIFRVCDIAGYYGIDLDAMAKEKMDFNETRPKMHGGKKLWLIMSY